MDRRRRIAQMFQVAGLLILALDVPAGTLFAKKPPKTYSEEGKIIATGFNQFSVNGATVRTHTYTVLTQGKQYVLDCHRRGFFSSTGEECGGDKKFQLGDTVHFRIEKDSVYIPITEIDTDSHKPRTGEEKLRILSQELKADEKGADKPEAETQKTDTKPPQ